MVLWLHEVHVVILIVKLVPHLRVEHRLVLVSSWLLVWLGSVWPDAVRWILQVHGCASSWISDLSWLHLTWDDLLWSLQVGWSARTSWNFLHNRH